MKAAILALLAVVALPWSVLGQAPGDRAAEPPEAQVRREEAAREQARIHARWNVCVDLQMVALEEAKALALLPDLQSDDEKKVEAAWMRLQAMIKAKEAVLLAWPLVRTVDGVQGVSETILEKSYPTEFEPPQEPQTFGPPQPKPGLINDSTTEGLPNAYETRAIGVTLEVEPTVLGEGKRVYLRLTPSRSELLEMERGCRALTVHNTVVDAPQPLFLSFKSNLDVTLRSGQRQLVAVHQWTKPAHYLEFHLVRAVITGAE